MPDFDRIRVLLHSDGLLHWEPGGIFRTTCDINIAYFPFDSQRCLMLIGAYSYHSSRMNITNASRAMSTHDFRVNGEWHIISTSAEYGITILSPPNASPVPDDDATDRHVYFVGHVIFINLPALCYISFMSLHFAAWNIAIFPVGRQTRSRVYDTL